MNFFSGSQLAVAIEDLANQELLESEEILADRIVREIAALLPLKEAEVPRKLINGFMRGSTSFNDDQLADELSRLQRTIDDNQDPMLIVAVVKNAIDRERRDIHIKRTQKSAVRQILRAVKDDLELVETTRPGIVDSFIRTKDDLLVTEIHNEGQIFDWANRVQRLFEDLFVSEDKSSPSKSIKPKGIVTRLAANNYANSWTRFIQERTSQISELAQTSKPLMTQSFVESSFAYNLKRDTTFRQPSSESIKVRIENSGQGAVKFEKTWSSKSEAKAGMNAFFSLLTTLVDPKERIDLVEISIESTNGISLSLQEVTQGKIKETLDKLLSV